MIKEFIKIFAEHRVAANLLMAIMVLAGVWSIKNLNVQFLPSFELDIVQIEITWSGASAEDIERSITSPIEQELRNIENLNEMTSTSSKGLSKIILEFKEKTDMRRALDIVKERVRLVRDLPPDAEEPVITQLLRYESIAKLLVTGAPIDELRPFVRRMERELLDAGIAKISLQGLPEEEIAITINSETLARLNLSLDQIAERIRANSQDAPAGTIDRDGNAKQLRSLNQKRDVQGFTTLPVITDPNGRLIRLQDIAIIKRRPRSSSVLVQYQGKPAIEMNLMRDEAAHTLKSAKLLKQWLAKAKTQLPDNIKLIVYDESWQLIKERINLLVHNGLTGLLLVLGTLFLFLNRQVALWVAVGIPIAFMGTFSMMYFFGGSINMVSLFAMIMMLGIVVDDAIVVGEETWRQSLIHKKDSLKAALNGANTMITPVMSAQLTTICAFLPLMIIGGVMGNILFDIPLIVICTLIGSLIESFFVLPAHLHHALQIKQTTNGFRQAFDQKFNRFRDHHFKRFIERCIEFRWTTITTAVAILVLAAGLVVSHRVLFSFFPSPDSTIISANVEFAAGTSAERVAQYLQVIAENAKAVEKSLDEKIIKHIIAVQKRAQFGDEQSSQQGDNVGELVLELIAPDSRQTTNHKFIQEWRKQVEHPSGLEQIQIAPRRAGPPGTDIDIKMSASSVKVLKAASLFLQQKLRTFDGVSNIKDDLPYGQKQLIVELTPQGYMMGFTIDVLTRQLQAAFTGSLVQVFHEPDEEVEVRVTLPDIERDRFESLRRLPIITPDGNFVPLSSVAMLKEQPGMDILKHSSGLLAIHVTADVDRNVNNTNRIIEQLKSGALDEMLANYPVQISFDGLSKDEVETIADMQQGLIYSLILIYIVLAWVFNAYGWPFIVLVAIPFGWAGGVLGHWLLGMDLTILSLFGLFGLSGVAINDSIILLTTYRRKKEQQGLSSHQAIIDTCCERMRPVLLTSLTTIAGLTPILFERSLQAQFLIPMAVSLCFGLMFSTILVLVLIPTLLAMFETKKYNHTQTTY